jgi:hypothetical protein
VPFGRTVRACMGYMVGSRMMTWDDMATKKWPVIEHLPT